MKTGRILLVAAWVLVAGCGQTSNESKAPPGAPVPGGVARIALEADPNSLNPVTMRSAQAARVFALLQPGLVRLDPDTHEWKPGLADSWQFGADSMSVALKLDTSLAWSDGGGGFRARDVVATYELYRDDDVAYAMKSRLSTVESVSVVDSATVRVVFSERVPDPFAELAHDILAAHVIEEFDRAAPETWSIGRRPVTLGAFRLADWTHNGRLLLERNPHYPGPQPLLEGIEIAIVPDAAVRHLRLKTGEVDMVASVTPNQVTDLIDSNIEVEATAGRSVAFLQYDLRDPALADVRVRRAISLAIGRRAIVDGVLFGYGTPAATLIPPVSWAHDARLVAPDRDLETAAELLREAGYPDRLALTMLAVAGDPVREAIASLIAGQLREAGIDLTVRSLEMGAMLDAVRNGEFQLLFAQLSGPVDADLRPFLASGGPFNFGHYESAAFDASLEGATSALERGEAMRHAFTMQEILFEDQPVTILYYPATLIAHRSRLNGTAPDWLTPFANVESWWLTSSDR